MERANRRKGLIKRLINGSLTSTCLVKAERLFSHRYEESAKESALSGVNKTVNCISVKALRKIPHGGIKLFKQRVARMAERSMILKLLKTASDKIMFSPVKYSASFFFSYSLYAVVIYLLKFYGFGNTVPTVAEFVLPLMVLMFTFPLIFSQTSLKKKLDSSLIASHFIYNVFGVYDKPDSSVDFKVGKANLSFILGMFFGLTAYLIPPYYFFTIVILIVFGYVTFCIPEFGLLVSVFSLPFLNEGFLCSGIGITAVAYIIKVLRGKRNLKFNALDMLAVLFGSFYIAEVLISNGERSDVYKAIIYLSVYFLTTNLICSVTLIKKTVVSLTTGLFVASTYSVINSVLGINSEYGYIRIFGFDFIKSAAAFNSAGDLSVYLTVILIIVLSLSSIEKSTGNKVLFFFTAVMTVISLVICQSLFTLTLLIGAILFYRLLVSNNRAATVVRYLIFIPSVLILSGLDTTIIVRFTDFIVEKSKAFSAIILLIKRFYLTGIGVSEKVLNEAIYRVSSKEAAVEYSGLGSMYFRIILNHGIGALLIFISLVVTAIIFTKYTSKVCSESKNKKIIYTLLCALLVFAIGGIFKDIWNDSKLFMLFWFLCGFISSSSRGLTDSPGANLKSENIYYG